MKVMITDSRWRVVAIAAALVALGVLTLPATADAGSYQVVQCFGAGSGNPGADQSLTETETGAAFALTNSCGGNNPAIGIFNPGPAKSGEDGRWTWSAPPGTTITHARAGIDLRNTAGYRGRVFTSSGDR